MFSGDTSASLNQRNQRLRSKTYDQVGSPSSLTDQESSDTPLIDFSGFYTKSIEDEIESLDFEALRDPMEGVRYSDLFRDVVCAFKTITIQTSDNDQNINVEELQKNDPALCQMRNVIQSVIQPEVSQKIFGLWPPVIPTDNEAVRHMIYFILKVLHFVPNPMECLQWFSRSLFPKDWYGRSSQENSILKGICLCHRKRKVLSEKRFFWAELTTVPETNNNNNNQNNQNNNNNNNNNDNNENNSNKSRTKDLIFTLYMIQNNSLTINTSFKFNGVKLSNNSSIVTVMSGDSDESKRFVPVDKDQPYFWSKIGTNSAPPFPIMITSVERPFPSTIIPALYEALTANDMLVVRCLIFYKVSKISNGAPLVDALLDIFSHAGKVNEFLLTLVTSEFEKEALTADQILRSNSHLTNLFKVFYKRFGINYYNNFLKKVVHYIDKQGDISMSTPINAPESLCKITVFTVLKHILKSSSFIPPQMRHLASILKSCSAVRFNNKQATYNTLNGFFCLRFLTATLADPRQMDPTIKLTNDTSKILIPFSSLLTSVFNLIPLANRFEAFNIWNNRLKKHIFPKLTNFILSIAEIDEIPKYEPPSAEKLKGALEFIYLEIANNHENFREKYNELLNEESLFPLGGWNFGSFLLNFFKENITTVTEKQ